MKASLLTIRNPKSAFRNRNDLRARAFAFVERDGLVYGGHVEGLDCAAGPVDFEAVNLRCRAEAEERARVVLRSVAAAADDLAALAQLARRKVDDRARRIARALLRGVADEFQTQPVVLG